MVNDCEMTKERVQPLSKEQQKEVKRLLELVEEGKGLAVRDFVRDDFPTPEEFKRLYCQEPAPIVVPCGKPSPQKITHNGEVYVRRDVVEHIILGSLGPKEALTRIRSL